MTIRSSASASEPAADFRISLINGDEETRELNLSDLHGSVVVLNFWASWCPPCRKEMPSFEAIYQEFKEHDVVFVGVAVSDIERKALALAEKVGVTYPLGMDTTGISRTYKVTAMPTTFFIDRDGTVTKKLSGPVNEGALRFFLNSRIR